MRRRSIYPPIVVLIGLSVTACDPGVFVSSRSRFVEKAEAACVRSAISAASGEILANPSERPDPAIQQLDYGTQSKDPTAAFGYTLRLEQLPDGGTVYTNQWLALGTEVPPEAAALVRKVDLSIQQRCGLPVAKNLPDQGSGAGPPE